MSWDVSYIFLKIKSLKIQCYFPFSIVQNLKVEREKKIYMLLICLATEYVGHSYLVCFTVSHAYKYAYYMKQ